MLILSTEHISGSIFDSGTRWRNHNGISSFHDVTPFSNLTEIIGFSFLVNISEPIFLDLHTAITIPNGTFYFIATPRYGMSMASLLYLVPGRPMIITLMMSRYISGSGSIRPAIPWP
jgi:hypothetical protein